MLRLLSTLFILSIVLIPQIASAADTPLAAITAPAHIIPAKCSPPVDEPHWYLEHEYPISYDGPQYWKHPPVSNAETIVVPDWIEEIHYSLYGVRQAPARAGQTITFTEATAFCLQDSPTRFTVEIPRMIALGRIFQVNAYRSTEIDTNVIYFIEVSNHLVIPCLCEDPLRFAQRSFNADGEDSFLLQGIAGGRGTITFDFHEVETGWEERQVYYVDIVHQILIPIAIR